MTAQSIPARQPTPLTWMPRTQKHDYAAAASSLSLLAKHSAVRKLLGSLKSAPIVASA